ncbi:MAG: methyltransferase [Vicinamibacterales bacterium]
MFDPSSRARLTSHDLNRFPGESLFDRIARVVCSAACLPRKELYEAWEMARRVRRHFRGGRVVDLAGGHGLLAHVLLLLDDSSPAAVVVDKALPLSSDKVHQALVDAWPRLASRVRFLEIDVERAALSCDDLVVSSHACGGVTDQVLSMAADVRARVAVLPCCHNLDRGETDGLEGWLDRALAIDVVRAVRLRARGYVTRTQTIPASITPKNRLLMGEAVESGWAAAAPCASFGPGVRP